MSLGKKTRAAHAKPASKAYAEKIALYVSAALVPAVVCLLALVWAGCVPFGDRYPEGWDCYTQYLEYLDWYRGVLTGENGLLYSFGKSLGGSMVGVFGYYLASPLNLIIAFFPEGSSTSFIAVLGILKVGLAGLTISIFMSHRFSLQGFLNVALSCGYALCSYVATWLFLGFMWLDAVIWLPLVALGMYQWLTERRRILFIVSLVFSIVSCWYTGYMICLFTIFYLPCEYFVLNKGKGARAFLLTYLRFGGLLLIGVMLSAFLLLPVVFAQMGGESIDFWVTLKRVFYVNKFTGAFFVGESNSYSGAPQMFVGTLALVACLLFLCNKDIAPREKVARCLLFLFVYFCAYLELGNELWCGLRMPRGYDCRFAFILAFLLVSIAARSLSRLENLKLCPVIISGVVLLVLAAGGYVLKTFANNTYFAAAVLLIVIVVACLSVLVTRGQKSQLAFIVIGCILVLATASEMGANMAYIENGFSSSTAASQIYSNYRIAESARYNDLIAKDNSWYRLEKTYSRMDYFGESDFGLEPPDSEGLVLGYSGISVYSSAPDNDLYQVLSCLGYSRTDMGSANYQQPIILSDALLGIKYVMNDDGTNWQNPYALSLGYAAEISILSSLDNIYTTGIEDNKTDIEENKKYAEGTNPFEVQNQFISKIIGREVQVFKPFNSITQTAISGDSVSWDVDTQGKKYAYAYVNCDNFISGNLQVNGNNLGEYLTWEAYYVFSLGQGINGDASGVKNLASDGLAKIKLRTSSSVFDSGRVELIAYYADEDALKEVINELKQHQLDVKESQDGYVKGSFNSDADTLLFTTVPYDEGWRVTVNGKQISYEKAAGAFIAIPVSSGDSEIIMTYTPKGLVPGVAISVATLIGLLVFGIVKRKRRTAKL